MAGPNGEIEDEFPSLFFEYMAASGVPDREATQMLLDVAAQSERNGTMGMIPREAGWLGR